MAKSQIIADLVNGNVSLEVALKRIMVLTSDFVDKSIFFWAQNELSGYPGDAEIPQYRMISGEIRGAFQIVGYGQIQTHNDAKLPTIGLEKEEVDKLCSTKFSQGISALVDLTSGDRCSSSLPMEMLPVFQKGTNINVLSANITFSKSQIKNVISKIESVSISVLIELEKNYGILDSLDIEQKPALKQQSIEKDLIKIVFEDNRIQIGDNNKINKTRILAGIKEKFQKKVNDH